MRSSGRLIFLDVGGHLGQTLSEVLRPEYKFDLVYSFEPMPQFAQGLKEKFSPEIADARLSVQTYGLSNQNSQVALYGDNLDGGASIYEAKADNSTKAIVTQIELRPASQFFSEHLTADDRVIMKLNCEGSECDILQDLINTGEIHKLANVMIDFDMFKVRGQRHVPYQLLKQLKASGFTRYMLARNVMVGKTHAHRIRNWLSYVNRDVRLTESANFLSAMPTPPKVLKNLVRDIRCRLQSLAGM